MIAWAKKKYHYRPAVFAVFCVLELACFFELIHVLVLRKFMYALMCFLTMALLAAVWLAERWLQLEMSAVLEIGFMVFFYICIVVGTVQNGYYEFDMLDNIMHTCSGFLCAAIGFALHDILNPRSLEQPSFLSRAVTAFCFSMAVAALWELWEYFVFAVLHMDMEHDSVLNSLCTSYFTNKDGVSDVLRDITSMTIVADGREYVVNGYLDMGFIDTMTDMLVCLGGTVTFVVAACIWKKPMLELFVPRRLKRRALPLRKETAAV